MILCSHLNSHPLTLSVLPLSSSLFPHSQIPFSQLSVSQLSSFQFSTTQFSHSPILSSHLHQEVLHHILHPLPNQLLHPRQRLVRPSLRVGCDHDFVGEFVVFCRYNRKYIYSIREIFCICLCDEP